ncbi:hypothetical protein [Frankia tisae]|uniref:hypothetical protein n=1 Tax=Frankia tisae TaxID=2950104 RepID=UPI0021C11B12|nr:hypothetical protein [Frankia tisae]
MRSIRTLMASAAAAALATIPMAGPAAQAATGGRTEPQPVASGTVRPVAPVDLGFAPDLPYHSATAINDHGVVVGTASGGSYDLHGFRWAAGRSAALPDGAPGPSRINNSDQIAGLVPQRSRPNTGFVLGAGRGVVDTGFPVRDQNERGEVVGRLQGPDGTGRAVRWWRGQTSDLGAPPGSSSDSVAISDSGQIAVQVSDAGSHRDHVARWAGGRLDALPTLPGGGAAWAADINDRGDIVGWADTAAGSRHAVAWVGRRLIDLGAALPGRTSEATAVNDAGQVVGQTFGADGRPGHGVRWDFGRPRDLGTLGGPASSPIAINDRGEVIGDSITADGRRFAFRWRDGRITALGDLGGGESHAAAINNRGQVVGEARVTDGRARAVLWP